MKPSEWRELIAKVRASDQTMGDCAVADWRRVFVEGRCELNLFINHYSLHVIDGGHDWTLAAADRIFADGGLLARQLSSRTRRIARRSFDFTSVARPVLDAATDSGFFVIFVGGTAEDAARFEAWLRQDLRLERCEVIDGFRADHEQLLAERLGRHRRVMIAYGTGTPKQEEQACRAKAACEAAGVTAQIFTCGGFITQTAASASGHFYPRWIDRAGLRWVWRCYKQPFVLKRLLSIYPRAFAAVRRGIRMSALETVLGEGARPDGWAG
jgi:N-acetylglucosaminyldiphosphoundecaprenol N-acetyl-beta-D-mannosaminyltransferase